MRSTSSKSRSRSWPRRIGSALLWLPLAGVTLWSIGALAYDFPVPSFRFRAALIYAVAVVLVFWQVRPAGLAKGIVFGLFGIVLLWWLGIRPSNDRSWQLDVAQRPGRRSRATG